MSRRLLALLLSMCMVMVVACSSSDGSDGTDGGGDGTSAVVAPGLGGPTTTDPTSPDATGVGTDAGGKFLIRLLVRDVNQRVGRRLAQAYRLTHPGSLVQLQLDNGDGILTRIGSGEQPDIILDNRKNLARLEESDGLAWRPQEFGTDVLSIAVKKGNPKGINSLQVFDNDPNVVTGACPTTKGCGRSALAILVRAGITSPVDKTLANASDVVVNLRDGGIDASILSSVKIGRRSEIVDAIRLGSNLKPIVTHWQMSSVSGSESADSFATFMMSSAAAAVLQESGLLPLMS